MGRKITSCEVKLKVESVSYAVDFGARVAGKRGRII
jgi:hypothetical protein